MKGLWSFVKTTLFGGFGVLLPLLILFVVFRALWNFLIGAIRPLTSFATQGIPEPLADIVGIAMVIGLFFLVGWAVRTRLGKYVHEFVETHILRRIPGYKLVGETVRFFEAGRERPFKTVALVRPFGEGSLQTAFVTDTHADGSYTVFVPQSPNPMQGDNYHLRAEDVLVIDVGVDEAMKTVIAGGVGTSGLMTDVDGGMAEAAARR
jgi:uncharacterized membrane protein